MGSENVGQMSDVRWRWRRNSQAALSAMLPSHTAIHSDSGLTLLRKLSVEAHKRNGKRRRSATSKHRPKSSVELDGAYHDNIQVEPIVTDLFMIYSHDEVAVIEDYVQTKENIKSMTASLAVKRKYRRSPKME
ncbi:hypothetical protein CHS0354_043138 [Potamilus streckersoni]|uniref:Uncharacterized protein n=1 Tax=Potamilus streckersoni TaxID=2493646 RepID=A0AAE0SBG7_9BIVA|nr:hypothetical protein CHS0354_043138 [Potamilus streckersoni]